MNGALPISNSLCSPPYFSITHFSQSWIGMAHQASHAEQNCMGAGIEFGPTNHSNLSPEDRHKYDFYYRKLKLFREQLPSNLMSKLSSHQLRDLASSLLDGTVFAIVGELEDIQKLTERSLLKKRMEVVNRQKGQRMELVKRHAQELEDAESKPHTLPLVRNRLETEKAELDKKLAEEMKSTDKKLVLELDQLVADQQSTMLQCALPLFSVTNNPQDVQLQMHLLRFLQKMNAAVTAAETQPAS